MATPYDWRIDEIERTAKRAESRLHEMDSLRVHVDRLERENRELGSCVDGLRCTCQALLERVERLEVSEELRLQALEPSA